MTLSESSNNVSMNFKICRQLIHEDFRKVLTQQPHGKISEYLYILRYLISNININTNSYTISINCILT